MKIFDTTLTHQVKEWCIIIH